MPWSPIHLRLRLAIWWALAASWFALGLNSTRVPYGNEWFWIVACGFVSGAALGYAVRRTAFSLSIYLILASIIGLIRSAAYLSNDSGGPVAVWLVIGLTNLLIYLTTTQTGWGPRAS